MTPLSEACWDSDIEQALIFLTRGVVKDHDYWSTTVARVEEGIDPETNQQITMSGLRAWVTRCKIAPIETKEALANDHTTRRVSPSGEHVHHT